MMTTTETKPTRREQRAAVKAEKMRAKYKAQAEALDSGDPAVSDRVRAQATIRRLIAGAAYRTLRTRQARKLSRALGWDTNRHEAGLMSTSQCGALDNALTTTQLAVYGPGLGRDVYTGQPITHSLIGLYRAKQITSPNGLVVGDIGVGKSSFVKTYLERTLKADPHAYAAVFDKKDQRQAEARAGEYARLATLVPSAVVPFNGNPRRGARINPLDPRIVVTTRVDDGDGDQEATVETGQDALLKVVAEGALGRTLNGFEAEALAAAHRAALATARAEGRVAILPDVVHAGLNPGADQVPDAGGRLTEDDVFEWGKELFLSLRRYMAGDMAGLIDGETQGPGGTELNLDAQLTIFDTSSLPDGSDALAIVMVVTTTYLMARWAAMPGTKTLVLEEAYSAANLAGVGEALRGLVKRSRGIGASVLSVMHHLDDIRPDSPLASIVKEAGVVHAFAQEDPAHAQAVVRALGLPDDMIEQMHTLDQGRHVLYRGRGIAPTVADGFFTTKDQWTTYTDHAMEAQ